MNDKLHNKHQTDLMFMSEANAFIRLFEERRSQTTDEMAEKSVTYLANNCEKTVVYTDRKKKYQKEST